MLKYILSFLLFASTMFSQSESQIGWIAKFGAAGGFSPMIMFPNYDDLNVEITKLGMSELEGPIIAWGGGGYAYVMIIDNLRLGGIGFSGSRNESSNGKSNIGDPAANFILFDKEVNYSLGGGAATFEYTFPFIKNIAVSAGLMIGGGSLEIDIFQNSGDFLWNDIWDDVVNGEPTDNIEYSLKNSFYFLSPTVNVDYPITRFLALRGGVGYQFTFGSDWEIANGKKLKNVSSALNGNGLFIQTGIFIGLFAF